MTADDRPPSPPRRRVGRHLRAGVRRDRGDRHQRPDRGVTHPGVALTFGLVVLALIYALGDVSGAHLNPAVTAGFVAAGRFPAREALPYALAQFAGATAASLLLQALFPESTTLGETVPRGPAGQSFVLEVVLTWFLMLVVLCVSTRAKEKEITPGVAIGAVSALEV